MSIGAGIGNFVGGVLSGFERHEKHHVRHVGSDKLNLQCDLSART